MQARSRRGVPACREFMQRDQVPHLLRETGPSVQRLYAPSAAPATRNSRGVPASSCGVPAYGGSPIAAVPSVDTRKLIKMIDTHRGRMRDDGGRRTVGGEGGGGRSGGLPAKDWNPTQ